MERLTRWNEITEGAELIEYETEDWKDLISIDSMDVVDSCILSSAVDRLAEYEDTYLSPQGVNNLVMAHARLEQERDFWECEAKKYCSQLEEIGILTKKK